MITEIRIGKKKYKINCSENEKNDILIYADRLDSRVRELKEDLENENDENILIIAGIMLEQELQHTKDTLNGESKKASYNEDELYQALSDQMQTLTNYIKKLTHKIENL